MFHDDNKKEDAYILSQNIYASTKFEGGNSPII